MATAVMLTDCTNTAVTDRLEIQLQQRLGAQVYDLRVRLVTGGLVLEGYARTYYAKQLAQHLAMKSSNLRIIANEIEVD